MEKPRILSGYELVAQGTTKTDASFPESGLKDVVPNGSWLEQKQIQSTLEARKQLINVQRIEKCGALSYAVWRPELQLAEVTKKAGGYWQFLGHNAGKQLFLKPEEVLFLMEVNCLQFKYNEVIVSLQQAYTLLLQGKVSFLQYKVYASLSRLGYKVFRHEESTPIDQKKEQNLNCSMDVNETEEILIQEIKGHEKSSEQNIANTVIEMDNEAVKELDWNSDSDVDKSESEVIEVNGEPSNINKNLVQNMEDTGSEVTNAQETNSPEKKSNEWCFSTKLSILKKRRLRQGDFKTNLNALPDMSQNQVVTILAPKEIYIPKNIFLNCINYVLNIGSIKLNNKSKPVTNTPRPYSSTEQINGAHMRRLSNNGNNQHQNGLPQFSNPSCSTREFRSFGFWRPQANINFFQYHMLFRPVMPIMNFFPRFGVFSGPPPLVRYPPNVNRINPRKRNRDNARNYHIQAIKRLAMRLKQLIRSGNTQIQNIQALQRLIDTYNTRYRTSLRLTDQYDIIEDDNIIETIQLDDDEEITMKRQKKDIDGHYAENLNRLKALALKFKDLVSHNNRHKRALANVVKNFNNSYNADVYVNNDFEVVDRRHIILDSSSESDCVVEEKTTRKKGKKLRNPFNIFKQLNEDKSSSVSYASTIIDIRDEGTGNNNNGQYSETLKNCFDKNWLPNEHDFGRVETIPQTLSRVYIIDSKRDKYLYDFIKNQKFDNWLDAKIAFYNHIEDSARATAIASLDETCNGNSGLSPLIKPDQNIDMTSVLNLLSVISSCKAISSKTTLTIDFDIYNRDVKNFRKSNRPKPHFRVICINESTTFPFASDVAALHSRYNDGVAILFAVVGIASISYLQINPSDIPTFIPTSTDSIM